MTTNQYAGSCHCQLLLIVACCDLHGNIYYSKQHDQSAAHYVDHSATLPEY